MNEQRDDDRRVLRTPHATVTLDRRPVERRGDAHAWDGADRLLIEAFHDRPPSEPPPDRVLIVGDSFGALTLLLRDHGPVAWSDSATSHLAIIGNLHGDVAGVQDGLDPAGTTIVPGPAGTTTAVRLEADEALLGGPFDVIVWRVPRAVRVLQHEASVIQQLAAPGALVLAAGMDKHLPPGARAMLEGIGVTSRRPGAHKAHVYELRADPSRPALPPPSTASIDLAELGLTLDGDARIFSPDQLDLGARVMLSTFDRLPAADRIADLGCGNGVLGIDLARRCPDAEVHLFDDSFAAVRVAQRNMQATMQATMRRNVGFDARGDAEAGGTTGTGGDRYGHWTDGMHAYHDAGFDLIVCNPPFHHHGAVTDAVAWQLFVDARAHLAEGGELRVVGNRHLAYHAKLQRLFGNCRQLAAHPKFVVLAATKRAPSEARPRHRD